VRFNRRPRDFEKLMVSKSWRIERAECKPARPAREGSRVGAPLATFSLLRPLRRVSFFHDMRAHLLLIGLFACAISTLAASTKPNVVVILCDDLGYGDIGCYGAKDIKTPQLDRMAVEGTRWTDFSVAAPLCTPSRAALMTGRYPGRLGLATGVLRPDAKTGLAPGELTLAEVMKLQGHVTALIGKWHLGFVPGMRPMNQGFDQYYGVLHNLDRFETEHFKAAGGMPVLRGDEVAERPADPAKMTTLYTAEALRFIEANRDRPFFLFLSHAMPHLPFDASPRFKGTSARGLYGDVVEELDHSTGQILDRLRTLHLAERTLVIFTSDNGPERNTPGTAAPLRGTKHTVFEGGVRVPFITWWPGTVPAGRVSDTFLTALDLLPTLAALTGAALPANLRLDGRDQSVAFRGGNSNGATEETFLYTLYGLNRRLIEAVRNAQWKLHLTSPPELYDLRTDLAETMNIAAQHPAIVQQLTAVAERISRETNVAKPAP
jgi:arylsulfatase A